MDTAILVNVSANSTMGSNSLAENFSSQIFQIIFMIFIITSTLVGNSCICWIIIFDSKLRQQTTNKLVMNLCWCDLLTAVVNGPVTINVLLRGEWDMGCVMCNINGFTTTLFGLSSILTLAVISLNRCLMISYPTIYSYWFTNLRTNLMIAGIWTLSTLFAIPPVFGWSSYTFIPGKAICTLQWSSSISYTLFVFIPGIFLPFFLMIASYYKIFITVKASSRRIESHSRDHKAPRGSSGGQNPTDQHGQRSQETTNVEHAKQKTNVSPPPSPHSPTRSNLLETSCVPATNGNSAKAQRERQSIEERLVGDNELEAAGNSSETLTDNVQSGRKGDEEPSVFNKNKSGLRVDAAFPGSRVAPSENSLMPGSIIGGGGGAGSGGISPTFSYNTGVRDFTRIIDSPRLITHGPRVEDVKITKIVLIVLLAFVICWSPISLVNFIETFFSYDIPVALDRFTVYLVFMSCTVNPIIFGIMNRNFRKGFRNIFCSCNNKFKVKRRRNSVAIAATKSS